MRYDLDAAPEPGKWLVLDETQRIELVSASHHRLSVKLPHDQLHAAIHVIVESRLAEEVEVTKDALARLRAEGLDRHEAICYGATRSRLIPTHHTSKHGRG